MTEIISSLDWQKITQFAFWTAVIWAIVLVCHWLSMLPEGESDE